MKNVSFIGNYRERLTPPPQLESAWRRQQRWLRGRLEGARKRLSFHSLYPRELGLRGERHKTEFNLSDKLLSSHCETRITRITLSDCRDEVKILFSPHENTFSPANRAAIWSLPGVNASEWGGGGKKHANPQLQTAEPECVYFSARNCAVKEIYVNAARIRFKLSVLIRLREDFYLPTRAFGFYRTAACNLIVYSSACVVFAEPHWRHSGGWEIRNDKEKFLYKQKFDSLSSEFFFKVGQSLFRIYFKTR